MERLTFTTDKSSPAAILLHLRRCNEDFAPPLSSRVDLKEYAEKLAANATRFEAWATSALVGLAAFYVEAPRSSAYISNFSVLRDYRGRGIAEHLLYQVVALASCLGMEQIELEVVRDNTPAMNLYTKFGFEAQDPKESTLVRRLR